MRTVNGSGDQELANSCAVSLKEAKRVFLEGPLHIDNLFENVLLTKRILAQQKNQICPIDDRTANMVNHSETQSEGVIVRTIDHVASMVAFWLKAAENRPGRSSLKSQMWDLWDACVRPSIRETF